MSNYAAHFRSSLRISTTKERYNQCQNINCGATFVSHESVARFISKPGEVKPVNRIWINFNKWPWRYNI
nr:ogr/Delta-like zinc finger family protein [Providencia sp.]